MKKHEMLPCRRGRTITNMTNSTTDRIRLYLQRYDDMHRRSLRDDITDDQWQVVRSRLDNLRRKIGRAVDCLPLCR